MEKRTLIAVVLAILIMVVWYGVIAPPPERSESPERATPAEGGESRVEGQPADATPSEEDEVLETSAEGESEELPPDVEPVTADREETVRVANRFFEVELTNAGARALSWRLTDYTTPDGQPLELLPAYRDGESAFLTVELDDADLAEALNEALYRVERERILADGEGADGERITFEWSDGRGLSARKVLEFREDEYLVSVTLEVIDRGRERSARLVLGPGFGAQEEAGARSNYYYDGQIAVNRGGEVTRIKRRKLGAETTVSGDFIWAGIEDQYFTALVLPAGPEDRITWRTVELTAIPQSGAQPDDEAPEPRKEPLIAVSLPDEGGLLYVGPKKYTLLREIGFELDKAVWFSSLDWLRPIVKYLFLALLWFHDSIAGNYGLAIVLATVVLRLLLFPVNQYSMVSMKKSQLQMQRLQPKIKAIKAKYKKKDAQTRAKINQETMELYRKEGVNPMGGLTGCLPLLAQFPILIGFYNMLTVAVELRGAPFFGWIQDLSLKDPLYITPVLMGVTMFIQQKMAMSKIKDPQQLQQQRIMLFMPIMFTVICIQMPAGLVLYWFVNNLLGMGQQWLVNRQTGGLALPPPKSGKKKNKA